jgi:cullin-associated NEDD8-dissociated protein 1
VLIFLDGAADSFNVLIPHSDCSNNDLQAQYQTLRTDVALSKNSLLTITAPAEAGQPCDTFGINPALPLMQELYEDGDAAFIANVGVLVEPMTLDEWHAESKQRPPNLYESERSECRSASEASAGARAKRVQERERSERRGKKYLYSFVFSLAAVPSSLARGK